MQLASDLESKIEVVNPDSELSDSAISVLARLLIALADVEIKDALEIMESGEWPAGWRKNC